MSTSEGPAFVIDKLRRKYDLSGFDCGNTSLDEWLKKFAWTNEQSDSAKTFSMTELLWSLCRVRMKSFQVD